MRGMRREAGFTLPELLVTVVMLVLFVVGASLLLRPADYGPQSRNGLRWTGVSLLAQGLMHYRADNGKLPDNLPSKAQLLSSEEGGFDLCPALVPMYMDDLPLDPQTGAVASEDSCDKEGAIYISGYTIQRQEDGRVIIDAPSAEQGEKIRLVIVPTGVRYE